MNEDNDYTEVDYTVKVRFRYLTDEDLCLSDLDLADLIYYQMGGILSDDNDLSVSGVHVVGLSSVVGP